MQQPGALRNLFWLMGFMVFMAGCTLQSVQHDQASPTPALSPVASPSAPVRQLKPESALPSSCPAAPIYQGGPSNVFVTSTIPWVQALPTSSGIMGHLFYAQTHTTGGTYRFLHTGGSYPGEGVNTKILWTVDHPGILAALQIDGTNLSDRGKTFRQTINPTASPVVVPSPDQYPSIVDVPGAGCWRLQITSGQASGTIIMWVVDKR
jgi:hypothetical protein